MDTSNNIAINSGVWDIVSATSSVPSMGAHPGDGICTLCFTVEILDSRANLSDATSDMESLTSALREKVAHATSRNIRQKMPDASVRVTDMDVVRSEGPF